MTGYKRVFFDTAPIIYYLQKDMNYFSRMKEILFELHRAKTIFVTSDITIAEYCVYPYRNNHMNLIYALEEFIQISQMELVHTSRKSAKISARLRAKYIGFKTMDALQIALAIENHCDLLLTNDRQLRQCEEMKCLTVDDFSLMVGMEE